MKKLARLTREFFFALFSYRNFITYFLVRCKFLGSKKVVIRLWNGISYVVHADANELGMINEIWNWKIYDPLLHYVHDGSTVIDIGANIGVFSMKAARAAKNVRVVSYEPFPESFKSLSENVRLNGLENNVAAINKAVAGTRGELELFFRPHDLGGVSLHQYGDKSQLSSMRVPAITLEDVFRDNKIEVCDYMKMDCEGAEEQILMTAPRAVLDRIRSITLEWHGPLNKLSIHEFRNFLHGVGYQTSYDESTITLYASR